MANHARRRYPHGGAAGLHYMVGMDTVMGILAVVLAAVSLAVQLGWADFLKNLRLANLQ